MINKINNYAENSATLKELRKTPENISTIKEVARFIILTIVLLLVQFIITDPFIGNNQNLNTFQILITLYAFITIFPLIYLYITKIEHRNLRSIGIVKENMFQFVLKGAAIGFILFLAVVIIGVVLGQYRFKGLGSSSIFLAIIFLIGFTIQSFGEELVCRGWIMTYFSRKHSVLLGILISNIIFVVSHIGNSGINVIAMINIFLIGTVFAVMFWKFDNLWICGAAHALWNFSQGILFGFNVSGMNTPKILEFSQVSHNAINGGLFGPESSLIATAVILIALIVIIYNPLKSKN